jgi:leader peptidase (prepilin peptidase)/N-methyltransferase
MGQNEVSGGMLSCVPRTATAVTAAALCALLAWCFGQAPALPAFLVPAITGVQLARIAAAALGGWGGLRGGLAGGAVLFLFYFTLALISPHSLGMGDVKLAAPLGLYLGYLGGPSCSLAERWQPWPSSWFPGS